MKKALFASILAIGLATAGMVYANGGYGMGGYGGGYGMMGPGMMAGYGGGYGGYNCPGAYGNGPAGWNSTGNRKYLDETAGLRRQLNDKRFEYQEALRNPATTGRQLAGIQKDISDLNAKIYAKAGQE